MKNSIVSPAAAAAELLRRRREALAEQVATGLDEAAPRHEGCRHHCDGGLGTLGLRQRRT